MPGPRVPTDVLKANGKKHLSKQEEADRRAGELHVEPPKEATPPKWLRAGLKTDFCELGNRLIQAGIYTDLDADTLGRYLVAHDHWKKATKEVEKALKAQDKKLEDVDGWGKVQERYFKQARNCANDMGLTVTSRCRLVVPGAGEQNQDADNPFMQLIQGGRAANG